MKTLRVYGDSFGATVPDGPRDWSTLLSKKLDIPLVNKAVHGGSTEYAALQFVRDVQNNVIGDDDVVIFVPSTKGRLHFDIQIKQRPETAAGWCHGPNRMPDADNTWYFKNKDHIEWWMVNYCDEIISMNFEGYVHLISNVARSKTNATFLVLRHIDWGTTVDFVYPENFFIPPINFTKITTNEVIGGYEYRNFVEFTMFDPRSNHLTVPNLIILSDLIHETLHTRNTNNFTSDKFKTNLIEKITSKQQYLDYVDQGLLDYSKHTAYHLRNL
jgi:hypothetical protein